MAQEPGLSLNMIIGIEWAERASLMSGFGDVADVLNVPIVDLLSGSDLAVQAEPYRDGRRPMGA